MSTLTITVRKRGSRAEARLSRSDQGGDVIASGETASEAVFRLMVGETFGFLFTTESIRSLNRRNRVVIGALRGAR